MFFHPSRCEVQLGLSRTHGSQCEVHVFSFSGQLYSLSLICATPHTGSLCGETRSARDYDTKLLAQLKANSRLYDLGCLHCVPPKEDTKLKCASCKLELPMEDFSVARQKSKSVRASNVCSICISLAQHFDRALSRSDAAEK